jgi:hypothetical protein
MRPLAVAVALVLTVAASSRAQGRRLHFAPESERFAAAARAYQSLWEAEGRRIIAAMARVSGLPFPEPALAAVVDEGISRSGSAGSPMRMRASDPVAANKATLIHELGHRHLAQLRRRPPGVDEHRVLFLFLYDVWETLDGKAFADAQVEVEKRRRGVYDYEAAWAWALAQSQEERAKRFSEMVRENQGGR